VAHAGHRRSATPVTHRARPRRRRHDLRLLGAIAGLLLAASAASVPVLAAVADGPQMEARVLLEGNARVGVWMAIQVRLRNDGPPIEGELRLAGGTEGRTRFGTPVDLPTQSDKLYVLYAQPPSFGGNVEVRLERGTDVLAKQSVQFRIHDANQMVVGVVAERHERIVPGVARIPSSGATRPSVVPLGVDDLPERVEAWASLDRLVWQDIDAGELSSAQLAALRGWLATGGRLIVTGGTAGPSSLTAFADQGILPYRPAATVDVPPDALTAVLGELPDDAADLPALAGELERGTALARLGDRVVAAEAPYGSGAVSIVGFDPAASWIAGSPAADALWQRMIPVRAGNPLVLTDDSQILSAVRSVPALALPPIGGLLALLIGYIVLIGPINYVVLRRLDRREWAWITMPILIVVFAVGSYAYGAVLRGVDVIVNEVAIVRGAPDATEGQAQVYFAVFSPSRGTYQLEVPGGPLLSSTINGEFATGTGGRIDVLQGDPARVRDLQIGVTDVRALRAETPTTVPRIQAELILQDETLVGTIRNLSDQTLEKPAIVLGSSVAILADLGPGQEREVNLPINEDITGQSLADRIVGTIFVGGRDDEQASRSNIRYQVISQLTSDPNRGPITLADAPVLLAWGRNQVLDVRVESQTPRRTGNVLYYIPLGMRMTGSVTFAGELLPRSLVEADAGFFNFEQGTISMGIGSATIAYRPIPFDGSITANRLLVSTGWPGDVPIGGVPREIEPVGPATCQEPDRDGCEPSEPTEPDEEPCDPMERECFPEFRERMPAVEVFDRRGDGSWVRLPELEIMTRYAIASPERYVDPGTGTVMFRLVNDFQETAFAFNVSLRGDIR